MTDSGDPHRDLAGVLHDVSNALTVLLGWIGEARAPGASAEAVAYALGIVEQRARIARDLARHAIGGPRVDDQREVGVVVEELAQALKLEAQRRGARLVVSGTGESAKVAGSVDLSQVLTNLVLNAVAHAPEGSEVDVVVGGDAEQCLVTVSDAGPGVELHRRESIFEGDSSRPGGVGVGLRHSRALARAWGGEVELLPAGERGARFRVSWPRADAVPRPRTSAARASDLSGLRVLVVEDDPAVVQLLEAALEARGAVVKVAVSAGALGAALADGPFDAALVDLSPLAANVPGGLAELRRSSPGARVLLITGQADALPEALSGESVELVRKPFEVREIVAALQQGRAKRA